MPPETNYCQSCGAELSADAAFCAKCGKAVTQPAQQPPAAYQQPATPMAPQQAQPEKKSPAGTVACCLIGGIGGAVVLVILAAAIIMYIGMRQVTVPPPPTQPTPAPQPAPTPTPPTEPAPPAEVEQPAPTPSIAEADELVLKFLIAIEQADAETARSCIVPGSEPFDLDLLGQGDFDHKGFDRVEHTEYSPTHLVFTAREIMEDWETGDYFYDDWGIVVEHDGGRWIITKFGTG